MAATQDNTLSGSVLLEVIDHLDALQKILERNTTEDRELFGQWKQGHVAQYEMPTLTTAVERTWSSKGTLNWRFNLYEKLLSPGVGRGHLLKVLYEMIGVLATEHLDARRKQPEAKYELKEHQRLHGLYWRIVMHDVLSPESDDNDPSGDVGRERSPSGWSEGTRRSIRPGEDELV